jgi:hypothetical protein
MESISPGYIGSEGVRKMVVVNGRLSWSMIGAVT